MKDYSQLKIKSYNYWEIYLHENQCYLGRVFVQLKDQIVTEYAIEDFLDISGEVREEFFLIGKKIKMSLKNLFRPNKMNYAALSNVSENIHVHIVPRYREQREYNGVTFQDHRWVKNYAPYDRTFILEEQILFKLRDDLKKSIDS